MQIIQKMKQYPLTQKIAVLILLFTLLIQFTMLLYVRISPPISKYNASSVFEYKVGPIIDQTATYAIGKPFDPLDDSSEVNVSTNKLKEDDNNNKEIEIPVKARIPHGNPRYYQMERGTCWDFALIGTIQNNYRQYGIEKKFLEEDEYVLLSTQVLGIRMVEHCNKHPDVCNTPGDSILMNSTSGGEINWYYSFEKLYDEMLPDSVCPYEPTDEGEFICDKMEEATQSNPIHFNITKMNIAYTVNDTKKMFIEKGKRALAWTSLIHDDFEYFPCKQYSEICNSERYEIVDCPPDYTEKECARITVPMYSPDGEFDRFNEMQMAGGHGMVVAGYNDEFVTKEGYKGGFILKNSWNNSIYGSYPGESSRNARGSHSIEYWMGEISAEDEKYVCPNAQNPLNWIACGKLCAKDGEYAKELIEVTRSPYEFQCIDENICEKDSVYRYFLKSMKPSIRQPNGRYFDFCMERLNTLDDSVNEYCYNALPLQVIALYYSPIDSQLQFLKDDEDFCGYYFFPYEIVQKQIEYFGGFNTIYFDIDWKDSSFAKGGDRKDYDYQYIDKSTGKQDFSKVSFMSSTPYINKRYF